MTLTCINRSAAGLLLALVVLTSPLSLIAQANRPVVADVWPKPKPTAHDYTKWEKNIAKFQEADTQSPPAKGSVLFVGSSTIVRWKTLAEDFAGVPVLNRGFGGNQIKDSIFYADKMIFPYEPKAIFLRAGGNDINAGWPAADVFEDFKAFVAKVRGRLPSIPIFFIGLSPTLQREKQIDEGNKLNDLVAAWVKKQSGITYIDTRDLTLDQDGKVRPDLFVGDMLHFNEAGYKLLATRVKPFVMTLK